MTRYADPTIKRIRCLFLCWGIIMILSNSLNAQEHSSQDTEQSNGPKTPTGFNAHKPNYILPFTWSSEDRVLDDAEVKFQLSIKQKIGLTPLYLAYTQKSFWEVYDKQNSRPFRETNYNPEFFFRLPSLIKWGKWSGDIGLEHESNGAKEPISRSWNRIYFTPQFEREWGSISIKFWYRIPEPEKQFPDDPEGDENPDIEKYYGNHEVSLKFQMNSYVLKMMGRWNFQEEKGGMQIDLSGIIPLSSMYWYLHYWEGYGESLIDYNHSLRRYGLGLMFTR